MKIRGFILLDMFTRSWIELSDKVLDQAKMKIDIEKFDDTKILIETFHKFSDDISSKDFVVLIACVIINGNKFDPPIFLEETLENW